VSGPLDGIRVIELGVWVAGPGAGGLLADWGADVVKVEPPEGDPSRMFGRMLGGDLDVNPVFELDNRGKRSVVLDLSTAEGCEIVLDLVSGADVFVSNIRAPALDRLGLGPDTLRARFDRLIYAIITGYGLEGADADRAAYDIAAFWARSGMAEALRTPGGPLPFQRAGMGDHSVAMTGAAMICAALYERERTGKGKFVSTSLLRQGAYTIGFDVNIALLWGRTIAAGVRETIGNPSVNNYTAGDGLQFWIVGLEGDRHWPALARAVGRAEWLDDPRFATARDRAKNARDLIAELDALFATRTRDEWAEVFDTEPELFWTPVNTIDELLADEQFYASGAVVDVPDEEGGRSMLASPADFDGRAPAPRWRAPRLGEHTTEVLREVGHSQDAIDHLIASGVAGPTDDSEGR
jgi:crotonobetainyl-CoA:carnitine CoA-transferase CaiB-like acyl-CoA transferase